MHIPPTSTPKSSPFSRSRRIGITFVTYAILILIYPPTGIYASSQASTFLTLAKIREAWVQDLRAKKLEPILKFYAPDAVFLQPSGERITGSAAIRTLFQSIMSTFNSDLTLQSQNLETSGDLAYDSGDFQETLTNVATGAKIRSKGSYITIFKRQPNGSWQIVQQVWTGSPPPGT
jgi:ketosteroid isomerase-like protein